MSRISKGLNEGKQAEIKSGQNRSSWLGDLQCRYSIGSECCFEWHSTLAQVCSLGVLLDSLLLLDTRMVVVVRGAFAQLWLVYQQQPYLKCSDLSTAVHDDIETPLL